MFFHLQMERKYNGITYTKHCHSPHFNSSRNFNVSSAVSSFYVSCHDPCRYLLL